MATHLQTGLSGEMAALDFIRNLNYQILETNWRYKHLEVDIIAMDGDTLVFIEVKTRRTADYGMPFEAVSFHKQQKLDRAANLYIAYKKYEGEIRFDIISVLMTGNTYQIDHIPDAFWPE